MTQGNNSNIEIADFSKDDIHKLHFIPNFLRALIQQEPSTFIDNACVEMKALIIDGMVLPLVISNPGITNSNVCSLYSHYIRYPLEEISRGQEIKTYQYQFKLLKLTFEAFGQVLEVGKLDHVVYVNNYLLTTNPHTPLSSNQLSRATKYLIERYPDYAIVFRNVNPYLNPLWYEELHETGYLAIPSRTVYLIDNRNQETSNRGNTKKDLKRDLKLLRTMPYMIVNNENISGRYFYKISELYRRLYLEKHSSLNPKFNYRFIEPTIQEPNFLIYKILEKDGNIDAFASYLVQDGIMTALLLGYNQNLPQKLGLYRMAMAILINEAKEKNLILNLSAGAGYFKILRGAFPVIEYDAIYCRHLSPIRRLVWNLVRKEGKFLRNIESHFKY